MSRCPVFALLRFPVSFFLLPVALFALASIGPLDPTRTLLIMVIIHCLLYPASNGFNSYYDCDTQSVCFLEKPPPPTKNLLWTSLSLDLLALIAGMCISIFFMLGLFIYGLASKLYSWKYTRLKARPLISLGLIMFGQGSITYLLVAWWAGKTPLLPAYIGQNANTTWKLQELGYLKGLFLSDGKLLYGALLIALLLGAVYPLTQVYQHAEDQKQGDMTYSRFLGIRGTFISSALFFLLTMVGLALYLYYFYGWVFVPLLLIVLLPATIIFSLWILAVWKDEKQASYRQMMRLNTASVLGISSLFLYIIILLNIRP